MLLHWLRIVLGVTALARGSAPLSKARKGDTQYTGLRHAAKTMFFSGSRWFRLLETKPSRKVSKLNCRLHFLPVSRVERF